MKQSVNFQCFMCVLYCLVVYVPEPHYLVTELRKMPLFHDLSFPQPISDEHVQLQSLVLPYAIFALYSAYSLVCVFVVAIFRLECRIDGHKIDGRKIERR